MNPPIPADEKHRLSVLQSFGLLNTPPEPELDEITTLAAEICGTPMAMISLVDETRQWSKSRFGPVPVEMPRADSFCAQAILDAEVLIVPDASEDRRFSGNPLVIGEPRLRFYAGAPLVTTTGVRIGTLCVLDPVPRSLEPRQQKALQVLSRQVMARIELGREVRDAKRTESALLGIMEDQARTELALRQSERALQLSEERWQFALVGSELGVWDWNLESGAVYRSDRWSSMLGYPSEEIGLDRQAWTDRIHPEDRESTLRQMQEHLEGRLPVYSSEHRLKTREGGYRWVLDRGMVLSRGEGGRAIRMVGTHTDIDRRKRGERLQACESRALAAISAGDVLVRVLEQIVRGVEEVVPDGIASVLLVDADGKRLHEGAAPGLPEEYRAAIEGLAVGPEVGSCGTAVHRRETVIVTDIESDPLWTNFRPLAARHGLRACWSIPVLGFEDRPLATFAIYFREPRSPAPDELSVLKRMAHVIRVVIDRDQREAALRQSEARFSTVFRASPAAISISSVDEGRFIEVNESFCTLSGFDREMLVGSTAMDLQIWVHPADRQALVDRLASEGAVHGAEVRLRRRNGEILDIILSLERILLAGESEPVLISQFFDITERRAADQRIRESQALLKMASRVSRLGAWQYESNSRTVLWSEEVREIHEVPPDYLPTAEGSVAFYLPEFRGVIRQAVADCVHEGTPFDLELKILTARGRPTWVRAIAEAVRDAEGKILRVQGTFQDITQRRKDVEQLRLLESCISRLNDIVIITEAYPIDPPGPRILYVNDAFERLTGYTRAEVLGKTPRILQGPKTRGDSKARIREALSRWESVRAEVINYTKDGRERWFELNIVPIADSTGWYTHWVSIQRDITERKQAEQQVRESEERFRLLSKATNDVIWDWDLVRDEIWWSEGFSALSGFQRDEIEASSRFWTGQIHPEDRDRVMRGLKAVVDAGGIEWLDEYRFVRKDGESVQVSDLHHLIRNPEGRPIRMIGGMSDITGRKRAEEQITQQAALIDEARDAIHLSNLDHSITFWSRGAERIFGWTAAEAMGSRKSELLQVDLERFQMADRLVRETGAWNGEIQMASKDGHRLLIDCRWTLLRDSKGQPRSILAIDTDVTERRKLEQQFLRAQRMESIGTLAGGIAHDLNNVLAPILMSIELLRMDLGSEERQEILDTIETSARRGADMVSQVLSFARGVEGRRLVLQARHLVRDVAKIVSETFPKNIEVHIQIPSDLHPVTGDPTQIHQVLINLCVNARDAMPRGGVLTLTASNLLVDEQYAGLSSEATPGPYVLIEVADTGTGILPQIQEKIFDPFFTTKELGKGTGLGLSTSLAIVRSHGGFIRVESEVGNGSRVTVCLPATTAQVAVDEPAVPALPRGAGELVLVVDDEASVRQITRQTLEAFGYRVLTANDGAEAVALYAARKDEIAVVLTDMMMPIMDGPASIQVMLRINPAARIIGASGLNADGPASRASSVGIRHFLPKPYNAETLLKTMQEILQPTKVGE